MNRNEFKNKAKTTINRLFYKLKELELLNREAGDDAQLNIDENIIQLKQKKAHLQEKYNELEKATANSWNEVKTAYSKSVDAFIQSLEQTYKKYK